MQPISEALRTLAPMDAMPRVPALAMPYADKVDLRVMQEDGMQAGGESDNHYFLVGATALNCVLAALSLARLAPPRTILDFGAGAGRVLRWLRAAFPDAAITACDIREQDMAFCAQNFQANVFISGTDLSRLPTKGPFDLLWVGSVFTHLPPASCTRLLDVLLSWCAPDGLVVFSTIGRLPSTVQDGKTDYHYMHWDSIVTNFNRAGFGYADYNDSEPGYGIAVTKPTWYLEAIERNEHVRLVMLGEAIWDNHQDVWALQKRPIASMFDSDYGSRTRALQNTDAYFRADLDRRRGPFLIKTQASIRPYITSLYMQNTSADGEPHAGLSPKSPKLNDAVDETRAPSCSRSSMPLATAHQPPVST